MGYVAQFLEMLSVCTYLKALKFVLEADFIGKRHSLHDDKASEGQFLYSI